MRIEWFTKKTQGAVSIMLCILLFPMILFSALVIDTTRIYAAKTTISGAGDLAMNARLSEYEKALYDMYGLFASCDNEADLKAAVNDYFKQSIEHSIGKSASQSEINNLAKQLTDYAFNTSYDSDSSFDNLVTLSLAEGNDFSVVGVPSSSLANPTIMKRQIIETMKYRGPVSLASNLLNKLSVFKNSGKQTKVLEKKIEYNTELDGLTQLCLDTYKAIAGYTIEVNDEPVHQNGYNDYANSLNNLRKNDEMEKTLREVIPSMYYTATLAEMLKQIIAKILPNNNYQDIENLYHAFDLDDPAFINSIRGDAAPAMKTREEIEKMSQNEIKTSLNHLSNQIGGVEERLGKLISYSWSEGEDITAFRILIGPVQVDEKEGEYNYSARIRDSYAPLKTGDALRVEMCVGNMRDYHNAYQTYGSYLKKNDWKYSDCLRRMDSLFSRQRDYLSINGGYSGILEALAWLPKAMECYKTGCETHKKLMETYELYLEYLESVPITDMSEIEEIKHRHGQYEAIVKDIIDNSDLSLSTLVVDFKNDLKDLSIYRETEKYYVNQAKNELDRFLQPAINAVTCLQTAKTKVQAILDQLKVIETKKSEWNTSISEVDEGALKTSMEGDYKATTEAYNKKEIQDFKDYLDKKYTAANDFATLLMDVKYNDISIGSGKVTVDTIADALANCQYEEGGRLRNAIPKKEYTAGLTVSKYYQCSKTLRGYSSATWVDPPLDDDSIYFWFFYNYSEPVQHENIFGIVDGADDIITMSGEKESTAQTEKFWFLLKQIGEASQGKYTKTTTQKTQEETLNKTVDEQKKKLDDDKKKAEEAGKKNGGNNGSIKVGKIYEEVRGAKEDAEKAVPTVSADSVKNTKVPSSGQSSYKSSGEDASKGLGSASGFLDLLKDIGTKLAENAYEEEFFTEMFSCQMDKARNTTKNLLDHDFSCGADWYGKEIEFILWGDSNLNMNLAKTEGTIYVIRLVINSIYAFTASDIQAFANSLAVAIAGWTVFGVPIVQAVITLGLALAESAVDLKMLKDGKDVVIMKSPQTFVCSPSGLVSFATEEATSAIEGAINAAKDKIVEGVSDVINGLTGKIGDHLSELETYVNGRIEKTMDGVSDQVTDILLTPLINGVLPICQRVDAGLETGETAISEAIDNAVVGISDSINGQTDSMVKEIELQAFAYFQNNIVASLKSEIISVTTKYKGQGTKLVEEIRKKIEEKVNKVKDSITGTIETKTKQLKDTALEELKKRKDQAIESFSGYMDETMGNVSDKINGAITSKAKEWSSKLGGTEKVVDNTSGAKGMTLNYKEYCKLFVIVGLIGGGEKGMLQRAAALVEANMRYQNPTSKFTVKTAYTMFLASGKVQMRTLLPWGMDISVEEGEESDFWDTIAPYFGNSNAVLNYTAISGY